MHLPLRSFLFALLLVVVPTAYGKFAAAEPVGTHYRGDFSRRPLDGSARYGGSDDWSASPTYRSREASALTYDGVPLLAPIWTGLYAGVHGGGGWGQFDTSIGDADVSGALVGAHIGYLVRSGALVGGLELDADLSQVHDARTFGAVAVVMADIDWIVSARGRLGVTAGPALFYGTGGVALMGLSAQADVLGFHSSSSDIRTALVVGGGVEFGLGRNVSLRLEALHYLMEEDRVRLPVPLGTQNVGGSLTTVRAGVTFFFN